MTDEAWTPLSVRESGAVNEYLGPYDDLPEWLFGPVWAWITGGLGRIVSNYRQVAAALRLDIENPADPNPDSIFNHREALYARCRQRPTLLLDVADFQLHGMNRGLYRDEAAALDRSLHEGGSVYTVRPRGEGFGLERRVGAETQEAADRLSESTGVVGDHLRRSWQAIYSRTPNPGDGYREAVKAVEAAAIPIVSPQNARATLGTVIGEMRANPARWGLRLHHRAPETQIPTLIAMMDALWQGQVDRHGNPGTDIPVDVSPEDAEAALHLALTIVQWFTSGVVQVVTMDEQS